MNIDNLVINEYLLNPNYYYHGFYIDKMESILKEGIKSQILLHSNNQGYNGLFYVSLAKRIEKKRRSIYYMLAEYGYPMFVIKEDIRVYVAHKDKNYHAFCNTPIPLRSSCYNDEYQKFWKVETKDIKGIRIPDIDTLDDLTMLKTMVLILKRCKSDIPLYDYTYENDGIIRELDKEKCLKL